MPIELAHATATTGRFAATTEAGYQNGLTYRLCRSYLFDMYAEHIVLLSHSACRIYSTCVRKPTVTDYDTDKQVAFSKR